MSGETEGLVKTVIDETTGRLLGVHVLGARAEDLVHQAREALQQGAPVDRMRALSSELQQVLHGLGTTRPADQGAPGDGARGNGDRASGAGDDDVIDADFTVT